MSDRWQELSVFVRVAEGGSFSRAARELRMSQPSVSRIIRELEARLGVKLLLRTTRHLSLTNAGAIFLERAKPVIDDWEDAEDAARGADSLRGVIRIAMPVMYGTRAVIPCMPLFLAMHPDLRVEITMSDERQNLVTDGVDLAIRVGTLDDSSFGARNWPPSNGWSWPHRPIWNGGASPITQPICPITTAYWGWVALVARIGASDAVGL